MAADHRDTAVDRLLRRTLRPGEGAPETDACLDAEILTAFADGSLTREGRASAEAHAADCTRCLQLLAAMSRTDEAVAPPRSWRMPVVFRWAVPLAAAATALALWVNVAEDRREPTPAPAAVAVPPAKAPVPPAAGPVTERLESSTQNRAAIAPETAATRTRESSRSVPESAAKAVVQPSPAGDDRRQAGSRAEQELFRAKGADEKREAASRRDAPAGSLPPAASPPAAAPAAVAERSRDRLNDSVARSLGAQQALMTLEVVSPDSLHRWRVARTWIERSTDGGKTWTTRALTFHGEILAGSSPSPNVCWLVGRAGAVSRTADGTTWQRIAFPEMADLTAVRARSEREADVTTADGRVFRTADGGQTWSLQETSSPSF